MESPVLEVVDELRAGLNNAGVVLLEAPPGAGKSTVLPLHLLNEPWLAGKKILMLEPRRLAAKSVAARLAVLDGSELGATIGYRIRFEQKVSAKTRLEVVTEGILTRIIQNEPSLEDVGLLIFDEFHERSIHADLALSLALQLRAILREDLRILIMSATLNKAEILEALPGIPVITASGRQYPIELRYLQQEPDKKLAPVVARMIRKSLTEDSGDILVFLPGSGEIHQTAEVLAEQAVGAEIHTLYGEMPFREQEAALVPARSGVRKVVLATSIAETSLTIEGIKVVIDSGLSRVPKYDPRSGLTRLETIRVPADSADQRAGRAGRLGPGICYRLWTPGIQLNLQPARKPEILEADLTSLLLELYRWGTAPEDLQWITTPVAGSLQQARELLWALEAIDAKGITSKGREMAELPTHPRLAHLLLEARTLSTSHLALACDMAAVLDERDPLRDSGTDLTLRLELIRRFRSGERVGEKSILDRIERNSLHWRKIFQISAAHSHVADGDVGVLLRKAYPERLARQTAPHSERYKLANGRMVKLPDHDPMIREPWLVIAKLDAGTSEGKVFLAAGISQAQVRTDGVRETRVNWDVGRETVVGTEVLRSGALVIDSKPVSKLSDDEVIPVLLEQLRLQGFRKFLGWVEDQEAWQCRVMSLKTWRPDESWPDVSDAALLADLDWLTPFLAGISKASELQKLDWNMVLNQVLPYELQKQLETLAPRRIQVPTGSAIRITYFADGQAPVMEVRLQEVFGWFTTPTVNDSRIPIVMHLLSPGYKPVQITRDLNSFWKNAYHDVRKELKIRYPKHAWPEDPFTATAVKKGRSEKG